MTPSGTDSTGAPEPEYIITESIVKMFESECAIPYPKEGVDNCATCDFSGKGARKGCCDFGKEDIVKLLRSRPAPTDTAKVIPDDDLLYRTIGLLYLAKQHTTGQLAKDIEDLQKTFVEMAQFRRQQQGGS